MATGISWFSQPESEVLYSFNVNPHCLSDGCLAIYSIEVGNTGRTDTAWVEVQLHNSALQDLILPPTARLFGKIPAPLTQESEGRLTRLRFGPLDRGKNVIISFTRREADSHPATEPEVIAEMRVDGAEVRRGDPNTTRFGRVLNGIAELF